MKAILVIDIDDNEDIKNYGGCLYHYPSRQFAYLDVPLKPMPDEVAKYIVECLDRFDELKNIKVSYVRK